VEVTGDLAALASELRDVIGQLMRRLRSEHGFSLSQGAVLGRLDRDGVGSVSDLAAAERVRPQSMAQTVADLEAEGLVSRSQDPRDGRRALVELTASGRSTLAAERGRREGWLAQAISQELTSEEQARLLGVVDLLRRLADS
jgi:DNA-binding MarR family transcriptional regulator